MVILPETNIFAPEAMDGFFKDPILSFSFGSFGLFSEPILLLVSISHQPHSRDLYTGPIIYAI